MDFIALILIAIGLTFDTFAVSTSLGILVNQIKFWQATRIALIFAFFQGLLPLLGWLIGMEVKHYIEEYDHWIAFSLLSIIGIKMIVESFGKEEEMNSDPFKPLLLLGMAVATSIDAFVVGITLAFIELNIIQAAFLIGAVTYIVAMIGFLIGKSIGHWIGRRMEAIGGLILIAIGVKILIEHL